MRKFFFNKQNQIGSFYRRRIAVISVLLISVIVGLEPLRSVQGVVLSKTESLITRVRESAVGSDGLNNAKGEAFLTIFKSPFKAVSKLLGRGKKNDNKLHRLTEKDVERFESARTLQIKDATSVPVAPEPNSNMSAADYV